MSELLGWLASPNIAEKYIDSINKILLSENNFNNFRNNNIDYSSILEHLSRNDGHIYANYIRLNYLNIMNYLNKFKENDLIGNPILYDYNEFGLINPTTLRYIKFFGDILNEFGDLNDMNLVEIGGGYGGLIKILTSVFNFKSIKLFDLIEPLILQKKYLNYFNLDVETYTYNDNFNIDNNTLTISNYAWCECDKKTRDIYINKIINKSKYVFMVVYGVDIENELMILEGEKKIYKETLNDCIIFTLKRK